MAPLQSIVTHAPIDGSDVTTVPGCLNKKLKLKEKGEKKQGNF